ncbi:MAG TPA: MBL fold metallo-hydrolase [Longimicrobium sp.]|nr:MBL fold metallo-hydrolase [Longimicrobium sp.]
MRSFPDRWIHGAPDCAASDDPEFQAHWMVARTCVLRQSKCVTFEAPFLYLLLGERTALLLDTGGEPDAGGDLAIRTVVDGLLAAHPELELVVGHTHSHGDHVFGDRYFVGRPNTRILGHRVDDVRAAYGIGAWPEGRGRIDLGGRPLTVVPAPGHEPASVCFHDAERGLLLTGDVLYPGLLTRASRPRTRWSTSWGATSR